MSSFESFAIKETTSQITQGFLLWAGQWHLEEGVSRHEAVLGAAIQCFSVLAKWNRCTEEAWQKVVHVPSLERACTKQPPPREAGQRCVTLSMFHGRFVEVTNLKAAGSLFRRACHPHSLSHPFSSFCYGRLHCSDSDAVFQVSVLVWQ